MQRTFKLLTKTLADGAQTIDVSGYERNRVWQIQIEVSATPTAGTLAIGARTPGASSHVSIGTVDLTAAPAIVDFTGFADSFQLTPASLDADKTYSAYVYCLQV